MVAQRRLGLEPRLPADSDSRLTKPAMNTLWGAALAASYIIVTLTGWHLDEHALSIIPVVNLLATYITLTPATNEGPRFFRPLDVGSAIHPLSSRVSVVLVVILGLETVVYGFPSGSSLSVLVLGLAKALFWYFLIHTVCIEARSALRDAYLPFLQALNSSWLIATVIGTFSIVATQSPFAQTSSFQALSHVVASLITLGQIIHLLPNTAKAKSALWAFSLVSLVPYLANVYAIRSAQSSLLQSHMHPVERLFSDARAEFGNLLQRQSKSYSAACDEYLRRYGVDPPPGFDAWYEYAVTHQSAIIDEFDTIYDNISPFWALSGKEVLEIMGDVHKSPYSELWSCSFAGRDAKTRCNHHYRTYDRNIQFLFDKLFRDLPGVLPDIKFLVNHLDEPRILVPSKELGDHRPNVQFNLTNMSRRPVWDILTKFCPDDTKRNTDETTYTTDTFGLPFVSNRSSVMDLCQHPEYSSMYGFFLGSNSFRLIEGFVPAPSTGSPSTMGDIMYPSAAYIESEFQYDGAQDIEWDEKRNNLYWAGSTTGGFASDDGWRHYHRQRFVGLARNLDKRSHYYLREINGVVNRVKSSFLDSRLYNVFFTRIFQCERKHCRDQRRYFNGKPWADPNEAFQSQLVFDTDGNGISGRFYKILASKSVPLKQTLLREWHDERLIPWVHYVPVSQGMDELPELVFYLTSTKEGQRIAKEIADRGRKWFPTAFRHVDLTIYTYRLMLELARLQDPSRPAGQAHV